jgi:hypothetical protein
LEEQQQEEEDGGVSAASSSWRRAMTSSRSDPIRTGVALLLSQQQHIQSHTFYKCWIYVSRKDAKLGYRR